MKWYEILGLFVGIVGNVNLNEMLLKIDYEVYLGLFLADKEVFSKLMCFFIDLYIKMLTGVNILDLEQCLRIFGVQ